jgi:hypothetical protein
MFEFKRTKQESKENNTSENRGRFESQTSRHKELFREDARKLSKKVSKW